MKMIAAVFIMALLAGPLVVMSQSCDPVPTYWDLPVSVSDLIAAAAPLLGTIPGAAECVSELLPLVSCADEFAKQTGCCSDTCSSQIVQISNKCFTIIACSFLAAPTIQQFIPALNSTLVRCTPTLVTQITCGNSAAPPPPPVYGSRRRFVLEANKVTKAAHHDSNMWEFADMLQEVPEHTERALRERPLRPGYGGGLL